MTAAVTGADKTSGYGCDQPVLDYQTRAERLLKIAVFLT